MPDRGSPPTAIRGQTIDDVHYSLQPLLDLWEAHPVELNYPPDHPKMPGEPPRVQPSKKVASHWDEDGNRIEPERGQACATGEPPTVGPAGARALGRLPRLGARRAGGGVLALSYDDQRTSRVPSGWTPLELLNHVLHMEQRWFVWGFLAEQVAEPWGDWTTAEPWAVRRLATTTVPAARWAVADDVTAEALAARLEAVGARTRGRAAGLPARRDGRARWPLRRRPADAGVDLLPRAGRVRPARRAPRHRGRAVARD